MVGDLGQQAGALQPREAATAIPASSHPWDPPAFKRKANVRSASCGALLSTSQRSRHMLRLKRYCMPVVNHFSQLQNYRLANACLSRSNGHVTRLAPEKSAQSGHVHENGQAQSSAAEDGENANSASRVADGRGAEQLPGWALTTHTVHARRNWSCACDLTVAACPNRCSEIFEHRF